VEEEKMPLAAVTATTNGVKKGLNAKTMNGEFYLC
jgi:hypothetical protein